MKSKILFSLLFVSMLLVRAIRVEADTGPGAQSSVVSNYYNDLSEVPSMVTVDLSFIDNTLYASSTNAEILYNAELTGINAKNVKEETELENPILIRMCDYPLIEFTLQRNNSNIKFAGAPNTRFIFYREYDLTGGVYNA